MIKCCPRNLTSNPTVAYDTNIFYKKLRKNASKRPSSHKNLREVGGRTLTFFQCVFPQNWGETGLNRTLTYLYGAQGYG
ncbi:hypothetical protein TNCV_4647901 [Trichonephila clavipes]|uniref:Uncharacterized protein n=1 Tax=Trichonephila clavipes TaxID=2585209 RepID=A0A8X6SXW2_TRICX|nr:hypothetical protein TNCV_4647901 [Trichonephila clavipes]